MNKQYLSPTFKIINSQFSDIKRSFQKPILVILMIAMNGLPLSLLAQTGCPDCVMMLPDSLQEDTFYLQEFPDGQFRVTYDESITYRLPTNTSQVLYLVPSLPAGIGIGELSVKSISNLPAGLSWEPNQKKYDLPDERDGCIRICGTPLQYGEFDIKVTVTAQVSILSQDATFTRKLTIGPPTSTNSGFKMTNNIACGETIVSFENNNPSEGRDGFSYTWDFGLGGTSNDENPIPQQYSTPGVYPVQYQAIIDTVGYILTEVKVIEASCDDFLGKPDIKIRITDDENNIVFSNESVDNLDPPITFPMNLEILEGDYKLEVIDDDSGLGGSNDKCGSINFNRLSNGEFSDGDLMVSINIFHPLDTVIVQDSVVVNELPFTPIISYDGNFIFCEGDTLELSASALSNQQQWYRDSTPIAEATAASLNVTETGVYYISSINEAGCISNSSPAFFSPTPLPVAPVLKQESNLLSIFNPAIIPDEYSLRWYQEGNLIDDYSYFALCISETGNFGVELSDNTSGCKNYFESVYTFEEDGVCTTSAEDLLEKVRTINIYPNPVLDHLTINLEMNETLEDAEISLVNVLGQTLQTQPIDQYGTTQRIQFNVTDYPTGLYLVQLRDGGNMTSWKVLKQ